jgi:restriction endonuclease S subunit
MAMYRWDEVLFAQSTSNAPIKNTASAEYSEGLYPAFSATGQDVWLPTHRYEGRGIVVSAVGARCGKSFKADGKWNVVANTHALYVNEDIALRDYCWYALNNEEWWIKAGSGQPFVKLKDSLKRKHCFPPIEEQRKIVEALNKVAQLISIRKEQLAKLDQLVKSRFIELFAGKGYPLTPVKELLIQNITVEKISNTRVEKFVTVGIRGTGARQRVIKDGKWPVPFSGYRVKQGQFIYSRIDARNGAFAILPEEVDNAVVSKDFPVFDIRVDKVLPSVLLFSVLQDDFVRQIQNSSFGATNRQRIQEDVFGGYTITLPPLDVQRQFERFVEQVDKSKLAIQESLAELETLKKALMQKYFG